MPEAYDISGFRYNPQTDFSDFGGTTQLKTAKATHFTSGFNAMISYDTQNPDRVLPKYGSVVVLFPEKELQWKDALVVDFCC